MSLLVISLAPRPKQRSNAAAAAEGDAATLAAREFSYVFSADGRQITQSARAAAVLLPRADSVVAVVPASDLAWHRITVPKAPAGRLRAALVGLLEEALLEEPESVHLALGPGSVPGQTGWVVATRRAWLTVQLETLALAQVFVDRVVPAAWPGEPAQVHVGAGAAAGGDEDAPLVTWSHSDGVVELPLRGSLGRALLPQPLPPDTVASATPAAAVAAEAWLGVPVQLRTEGERALQAAGTAWELRQFELVRRHRGSRALRDAWRAFLGPDWRPVRHGLVALVAIQLLGLNLWAWQLDRQVAERRTRSVAVLQDTFPQVRGVLDAPVQMEREVQRLRAEAGQVGPTDLEPLMAAAAAAWPPGRPPVDSLRFEPGSLSLAAVGWSPDEVDRFRGQLRNAGYAVAQGDGRLTVTRAATAGSGSGSRVALVDAGGPR
jgi:general secretion pathway protein L